MKLKPSRAVSLFVILSPLAFAVLFTIRHLPNRFWHEDNFKLSVVIIALTVALYLGVFFIELLKKISSRVFDDDNKDQTLDEDIDFDDPATWLEISLGTAILLDSYLLGMTIFKEPEIPFPWKYFAYTYLAFLIGNFLIKSRIITRLIFIQFKLVFKKWFSKKASTPSTTEPELPVPSSESPSGLPADTPLPPPSHTQP